MRKAINTFKRRVQFTDSLLFLYIAVVARQYFWLLNSNSFAGCLTLLPSVLVWAAYVWAKEPVKSRTPRLFWLIVAAPLLVAYALRVAVPDRAYDVLTYHIFHGERALRGELFIQGDFFPAYFPFFNPAPDMVTGIFRHLLGYRLGTLVNYLVLLWTGAILCRILRPFIKSSALLCAGVLLLLWTENLLFEINNYMVDLLALPLLLEATYLVFRFKIKDERKNLVRLAFLLGMCVAFKLTNVAFVVPIALVYGYQLFIHRSLRQARIPMLVWLAAIAALSAPLLPHTLHLYTKLQSPVFPYYNKFFKSPYYALENIYDFRFGPVGLPETFIWPVKAVFVPQRLYEMGVYTGRVSIGFLLAWLCLLLIPKATRLRPLCLIFIGGSLIWSASAGNIRYALYLEILGGMILLLLSNYAFGSARHTSPFVKRMAATALCCVLAAQSILATPYFLKDEWGTRASLLDDPQTHRREALNLFQDRSLVRYLSTTDKLRLSVVEAWVESFSKTSAIMIMLKSDVPVIAVNGDGFFSSLKGEEKYRQALHAVEGKRLFSICRNEELETALTAIKKHGLAIKTIAPIEIPYYSNEITFKMMLIEVSPPSINSGAVNGNS